MFPGINAEIPTADGVNVIISDVNPTSRPNRHAGDVFTSDKSVLQPSSCLYNLLSPPRDTELSRASGLRRNFPEFLPEQRNTNHLMSFAIAHYQ